MNFQSEFYNAVLTPEADVPAGLTDGHSGAAGKRFDVYRNNVTVSLTEALETAFPVVRKLVGDKNFKILAGAFLRKHQPSSPLLMLYGAELPGFLETFPPTSNIGYLPDIARLEQGIRESYHAEDATAIDPVQLSEIAPDDLAKVRLTIAPSVRLFRSPWPIHAIWVYNREDSAEKPKMQPEDVAVFRAEFDPEVVLLPAGAASFIEALCKGSSLGEAIDKGTEDTETFDLSSALTLLVAHQAITDIGT